MVGRPETQGTAIPVNATTRKWMLRWKLMGKPSELPLKMFLSIPADAFTPYNEFRCWPTRKVCLHIDGGPAKDNYGVWQSYAVSKTLIMHVQWSEHVATLPDAWLALRDRMEELGLLQEILEAEL